jgi:hypothetical protein
MDRTETKRLPAAVSGLFLLLSLHLGPAGCQNTVWVCPEEGSVQEGPFGVQVYWAPEMVASTLRVSMNNEEITGHLSPADIAEGVLGVMIRPLPGRKLLSAQLNDSLGIPFGATSVFTSTSTVGRDGFGGGLLTFECESSFLNSPIQVPGFDLDLGLSERICQALPIRGLFPSGDSAFPAGSDLPPVLFGVFPKQVTYDVNAEIPNGISLSPVELGLSLPFDPLDPGQEGKVCGFSFVMEGTILPVDVAMADQIHGVMVQSLRELSLSLVSGGQCELLFTSPADRDIMTFNYVARK